MAGEIARLVISLEGDDSNLQGVWRRNERAVFGTTTRWSELQ
ncbi:MAG: hypothetical protein ACR2OG_08490 [Gemmatimonadaceae bacterium]